MESDLQLTPQAAKTGVGNYIISKNRNRSAMKRYVILLFLPLSFAATVRAASPKPTPMYIVNGKETTEIRSIPPEDIENVEMLPRRRRDHRPATASAPCTASCSSPCATTSPRLPALRSATISPAGPAGTRANPPPAWCCATGHAEGDTVVHQSSNLPTNASNGAC